MGPTKKQKIDNGQNGSSLAQLRAIGTVVVADTGDFESIAKYKPQDSTTNPTLILAAAQKENYKYLVDNAVEYGKKNGKTKEEKVEIALDKLLVEFGSKILSIVPGRVSTEIDARLSFDKEATIKKARHIIGLYEDAGFSKERVLIKIASTWEGIQAARELEANYDIHCNLTLLFSFPQAVACAEANVTLISPFVGRIMDFYKAKTGKTYSGDDDPGVQSVKRIFYYYKKHNYKTIVMGASFRNLDELKALAGIDNITLSLALLEQLSETFDPIPKVLDKKKAVDEGHEKISYIDDESKFRYDMNDDAMVTEKLSDGIRKFAADAISLQTIIEEKIV